MAGSRWCREGFGRRLRAIRKLLELTQVQAAKLCGMDGKSWGAIERAERNLRLDGIGRIAKGLKLEPALLFMFSAARIGEGGSGTAKEILRAIRVARPKQKLLMLGLVNEVINNEVGGRAILRAATAREAEPPAKDGGTRRRRRPF